jgi:hypothetical protein
LIFEGAADIITVLRNGTAPEAQKTIFNLRGEIMKTIKLSFVLLLLSLTICPVASAKDVSFRQQQIEANYAARMKQLYAKAELESSKLSVTDRLLWIEYITGAETPYSDRFSLYTVGGGSALSFVTFTETDQEVVLSGVAAASVSESDTTKLSTLTGPQRYLQAHLADSFSLSQFAAFLLSEDSSTVFSSIADSRFQNRRLRYQARYLLRTAERLHTEARQIEAERKAALAAMQQEKEYKAEEAPAPAEQAQPQPVETGVVTAVSYSPKGSICMVEGVDAVLSQGDVIETDNIKDVKVVSISRDSVQFSKNGKTWTQKLGEEASSRMSD